MIVVMVTSLIHCGILMMMMNTSLTHSINQPRAHAAAHHSSTRPTSSSRRATSAPRSCVSSSRPARRRGSLWRLERGDRPRPHPHPMPHVVPATDERTLPRYDYLCGGLLLGVCLLLSSTPCMKHVQNRALLSDTFNRGVQYAELSRLLIP